MVDKEDVRRCLNILTICSGALFLLATAALWYASYRDKAQHAAPVERRPSVEFTVRGSEWSFYAAPRGLGLRIMHPTEAKQVTGVMTLEEWKAWSLKWQENEPLHQFAGFSVLPRGQLSRATRDPATQTFTGYHVGSWRAVFVPRWAALVIPALLPLIMIARFARSRLSFSRPACGASPSTVQA